MKLIRLVSTLIIFFHLFEATGICQIYKICSDTNFVKPSSIKIGDLTLSINDFYRNIGTGKLLYYQSSNCNKKDIETFLLIEGEFLDSLKNGPFRYYYLNNHKRAKKRQLHLIINYTKGIPDGDFIIFAFNNTKLFEGHLCAGQKNGFFIEYDPVLLDNTIRQIDFYINDKLEYTKKYKADYE